MNITPSQPNSIHVRKASMVCSKKLYPPQYPTVFMNHNLNIMLLQFWSTMSCIQFSLTILDHKGNLCFHAKCMTQYREKITFGLHSLNILLLSNSVCMHKIMAKIRISPIFLGYTMLWRHQTLTKVSKAENDFFVKIPKK